MANDDDLSRLRQGAEVWNAWRTQNPERRVDLRGADLAWANLAWANLSGADLGGADLRGANLAPANLSGADLRRADLGGADLGGADLNWANLGGANLSEADLVGANLTGADLTGTNLEGVLGEGVLSIPLGNLIPASELGHLLNGLAELYEVHQEIVGGDAQVQPEALVAKRISVGTPNVAELLGTLPEIANAAAALLVVLKIPKIAEELAEARKTWIEGTLLKLKARAETRELNKQHEERIALSFDHLANGISIVSGNPKVRLEPAPPERSGKPFGAPDVFRANS